MTKIAMREFGKYIGIGVRILGGKNNLLFADGVSYVINRNPDSVHFCGSVYPTSLLRTFEAPKSVPCFDGHLDYGRNWTNQVRSKLGEVRDIHWCGYDQSLRGWWLPTHSALLDLLRREREGELLDVSGDCRIEFEPLSIGNQDWKLVTRIEKLMSVDAVPESTGGGRVLRQSEIIKPQRVRLSAGGRILNPKEVRT